ncbi:hypothetical protein [Nonomuraea cypriaca]|nr:hypothetical protein [Nonomuraea cypriaca]
MAAPPVLRRLIRGSLATVTLGGVLIAGISIALGALLGTSVAD